MYDTAPVFPVRSVSGRLKSCCPRIEEAKLNLLFIAFTGCIICLGKTFGASPEPQGGFTKILIYTFIKVFIKPFYSYKIFFLRNHVKALRSPNSSKTLIAFGTLVST